MVKQEAPEQAIDYPSVRLWSGIVSIGWNLALVWGFWWWVRGQEFAFRVPEPWEAGAGITLFFLGLGLLNLPLDWVTGYWLEKVAGRSTPSLGGWWLNAISGFFKMLLLQILGGILFAAWLFNYPGSPVVLVLIPGIYVGLRIWQFHWIPTRLRQPAQFPEGYRAELEAELKRIDCPWPDDLFLYRAEEDSLINGGRVGMGDHQRLMISDACVKHLHPRELALLIKREERFQMMNGSMRNLDLSLVWVFFGVLLVLFWLGWENISGWEAFFAMVAGMTTWHWVGLFVLPTLARREILATDRWIMRNGSSREEWGALLRKLQKQNQTDEELGPWVERVFHPIPSLKTRLENLK
jgi:hypothetical protein